MDTIKELKTLVQKLLDALGKLEAENQELRQRLVLSSGDQAPDKSSVLVVDPDVQRAGLLAGLLEKHNCQVWCTTSSSDAVSRCQAKAYDLVIVESDLAETTGIDTVRQVKAVSPGSDVVIIVGFTTADNAVEALRNGATGFLLKPYKEEDVVLRLREIIRLQQAKLGTVRQSEAFRAEYEKLLKSNKKKG